MSDNTNFFEELKSEWISCGGIVDENLTDDDSLVAFIITNELF